MHFKFKPFCKHAISSAFALYNEASFSFARCAVLTSIILSDTKLTLISHYSFRNKKLKRKTYYIAKSWNHVIMRDVKKQLRVAVLFLSY